MLFVNDDVNDELFKKAAGNYPLKTDQPDWDGFLKKMEAGKEPEPPAPRKKRRYFFLLLLLLLISAAVVMVTNNPFGNGASENNTTDQVTAANGDKSRQLSSDKINTNPPAAAVIPAEEAKNPTAVPADQNIAAADNGHSTTPVFTGKKITVGAKNRFSISSPSATADINDEQDNTKGNRTGKRHSKKPATRVSISHDEDNAGTTKIVEAVIPAESQPDAAPVTTDNNMKAPVKNSPADQPAEIKKTDSASVVKLEKKEVKQEPPVTKKEEKNKKGREKHFYIGIAAGPDLTAVKMQSVKKAGFTYGAIAGYQINKRWSVETGFFKEKKYYNTAGKYFSTDKIKLPAYLSINYAAGSCSMWELPLNVHYSFGRKARSAWYATAGFSSYFMKNESYLFDMNYYGYNYSRSFDYHTKDNAIFSVINLGIGFTYKLGKIGDLRAEPYLKLPVQKIGTGELPLQSAGIQIGFTKNIF